MKFTRTLLLAVVVGFMSASAFAAGDAKHLPGVFLGVSKIDGETDFTYGIEYEYKFTKQFGVGAVYERIDDAHHGDGIRIALASLYYHPNANIRLGLGAGKERIGGYKTKKKDLVRVSAAYDFHVGDFGIAPTFAVDFVDGKKAYVLGVAFLRPF